MGEVEYLEDLLSSDDEPSQEYTVARAKKVIEAFVSTVALAELKAVTLGVVKRQLMGQGWPRQWVQDNKDAVKDVAHRVLVNRQAALQKAAAEGSSSSDEESSEAEESEASEEKEMPNVQQRTAESKTATAEEEKEEEDCDEEMESSSSADEESGDEEGSESESESESESDSEEKEGPEAKVTAAKGREREKPRASEAIARPLPTLPLGSVHLSVLEATASKPSAPLILHFPNAPPPETSLHNGRSAEDRMILSVRQCKDKRRAQQRAILGETERMEYVGTNYSTKPSANSDVTKFVVGLFDRKTMKLKLVETPRVFAMQQNIKEYQDIEDNVTVAGYYDAQKELVSVFGGKKSKRVFNKAERYRVEETDTLTKQLHTSISKTSSVVAQQLRTADVLAQRLRPDLPPYHMEATERHDIYRLDEIIEEENWEALERFSGDLAALSAQELAETRASNEAEYPSCVLVHFAQLSSKKGRAKKKFAAQLCYLTFLVWFYKYFRNHNKNSVTAIATATGVPEGIAVQFLKLFTEQQTEFEEAKFVMPKPLKLRLIHYILVVHLVLSSWSMRLDVISKDLLFDDKRISLHAASIGCKVTRTRKRVKDSGTPAKSPKKARTAKEGTLSAAMDVDDGDEDVAPALATKSDGDMAVPPGTLMASLSCPLTFPELRTSRTPK